jgi:hypothetical protein
MKSLDWGGGSGLGRVVVGGGVCAVRGEGGCGAWGSGTGRRGGVLGSWGAWRGGGLAVR